MSEQIVWWVLDATCDKNNVQRLRDAVSKSPFCQALVVKDHWTGETDAVLEKLHGACLVYHGPVQYTTFISDNAERNRWTPGVYADLAKYACTAYYPKLRSVLLNSSYVMLPYGDLLPRKNELFRYVGCDDHLFIRPNSVAKKFNGTLVDSRRFDKVVEHLGHGMIKDDELVVVAEPVNILGEWRFFVVDGVIVAGSQYRQAGAIYCEGIQDFSAIDVREVYDCALEAVRLYKPGVAFVVDVARVPCRGNPTHMVIEIGPFSAAGLYASDVEQIVYAVNIAARREWIAKNQVNAAASA